MLLESQNEVTKVTSDVAKHLADLANGKSNDGQQVGGFSVVQELQTMIETLQEKQKSFLSFGFGVDRQGGATEPVILPYL